MPTPMFAIHAVSGMGWILGCWPRAQVVIDVPDRGAPMMKMGPAGSCDDRIHSCESPESIPGINAAPGGSSQGIVEVGAQVLQRFHADGQAHEVVGDAEFGAARGRDAGGS